MCNIGITESTPRQESKPRTEIQENTESKESPESSVSSLDSDSESKDSQKQNLESSLLDSHSHGYSLDSQNHLFAQKEKGFIPSRLAKAPKRIKRRFILFGNQGECLAISLSSQKC